MMINKRLIGTVKESKGAYHDYRNIADECWIHHDGSEGHRYRLHRLGCVWAFHIIYFIFGIKTIPTAEAAAA
jgi:hypothetical protein